MQGFAADCYAKLPFSVNLATLAALVTIRTGEILSEGRMQLSTIVKLP